ncbi:lytic transglycosylase domain-containing protein [Anaerococcus hydrogenalis]|uniref:Lytic murein transglycosylase n=1 Tax=Anaerococcus hydrogenalis TaxID=33029 RepID=A0A2N6UKE1_9FIRM|nr:lytic transglycosylase domain-containing protein [Anaerococcus hydrogenalis]MDK7694281.1 lytic transglycosylase domain-containing protein [Anaerococcus hydrogenalis]MDK7696059.1 lytic transglycosylase domain-containing protein [Anaerococcus hydrogenalis]MDK7707308.1 lytic transglycosylase domain-containing protein [Anaerococcus hydrogenalis]PMC82331.1 lytic murein transglycosylase [Anaerococcus hydrogenalis]
MKALKSIFKIIGLIIISVVMAIIISFSIVAYQTSRQKIAYQDQIKKYSKKYNMDPLLIASIIKVESDYDNEAHSNQNAKGLMQLLDTSAKHSAELIGEEYYPDKLKDVDYNLNLGVGYFNYLYKYYNDVDLALAAYNGGIGNVDKWIQEKKIDKHDPDPTKIPVEETRQYVIKINSNYDLMKVFYDDGLPSEKELKNRKDLSIKNYKKFVKKILFDVL